uniref:Gamma-interferon-inducible lysosomal thiol reductase n=1 Tax=Anthurium amnicola TaxID=1678845 RepID=A0A1D1XDB5_9ARAE
MASNRAVVSSFLLFSLCCFHLSALPLAAAAAATPEKVRLELYYETLCPYCSRFIVSFLSKIFEDGLISIVDLNLVPYGNARVASDGTITCQHGPYECLLNTIEACAISAWPDVKVHFSFIYCVEQLVVEHRYGEWESCFQTTGLESQPVLDCQNNGYGEKLELKYAAETDALDPPHRYVPWVVVNGQPLYDDYETFEAEVCKAYNGDLPKACGGLLLTAAPQLRAYKRDQVCYANDAVSSPL